MTASGPRRVHVNASYVGAVRSGSALTRTCPVETCAAKPGWRCRTWRHDGTTHVPLAKPHAERRAKYRKTT